MRSASHCPRVKISALMGLCLVLGGCSGGLSRQLLERPQSTPEFSSNKLSLPPTDAMAPAFAETQPGDIEEQDLPADVPTLKQLSDVPPEAVDAPKVAAALEADQAQTNGAAGTKWRGKRSADGVDLVNAAGVLCSGPAGGFPMRLACSDGRVGVVKLQGQSGAASFQLGNQPAEHAEFAE